MDLESRKHSCDLSKCERSARALRLTPFNSSKHVSQELIFGELKSKHPR